MRFGVSQTKRAAPRAAENIPFFDAEFLAQSFDVVNQIPGRIFPQFGVRRRFAGAALVKQNDVKRLRVEKLSIKRNQSAARSAVQKNDGNSVRISGALVINFVNIGNFQHSRIKRFDFRIKSFHNSLNHTKSSRKKLSGAPECLSFYGMRKVLGFSL